MAHESDVNEVPDNVSLSGEILVPEIAQEIPGSED